MPSTQESELLSFVGDPLRKIVAHLAKNVIVSGADEFALADLHECAFSGYAPIEVRNWHVDPANENDLAQADADLLHWQSGPGGSPELVSILYLTQEYDGGAPQLWRYHFLNPRFLVDREDVTIDQKLTLIFADLPQ